MGRLSNRAILRSAFCLAGLFFLAVGVGLTGTWQTALVSLGVAVLVPTAMDALQARAGLDLATELRETLGLDASAARLGVKSIAITNKASEELFARFEKARTIDLLYNTAKTTLTIQQTRMEKALKNRCKIRVLVANPENEYWSEASLKEALCPGTTITTEILDTLNCIAGIVARVKQERRPPRKGSIEVRGYASFPTGSIVVVDGARARHVPYLPHSNSQHAPAIDTVDVGQEGLLKLYEATFQRLWDSPRTRVLYAVDFNTKAKDQVDLGSNLVGDSG